MKHEEMIQALSESPDLAGLADSVEILLRRAEPQILSCGELIYAEGAPLDQTFCLLLSGDLIVEQAGKIIGGINERQVFGEMAYFTNARTRTATVRVGSPEAVLLKFQLTAEELAGIRFAELRKCLSLHTWHKFVSTCQTPSECTEMITVE